MPEYLRALIVIIVLSTVVFAFAHRSASAVMGAENFTRRRNLWFALTLAAFLSHSFWAYTFIALLLLTYARRRETNSPALFFFLLFALPTSLFTIPGVGLISYFFNLSHARILELFILLPAFLALIRRNDSLGFGRIWPDRLLAGYILLYVVLYQREMTITDTMRQAFYMFIDVFLPYFVISRSLKDMQTFRDALLSLVIAIMVVAILANFETIRHWLLYRPLLDLLDLDKELLKYLERDGILRAVVTAGQAIPLGFLIAVGLGLYLYLQHLIRQKFIRRLGVALLVTGMIAPLSRGPWVGAVVLMGVFFATGRYAIPRLTGLVLAALFAFFIIAMLPGGERIINLLPFIGTTEKETIEGREKILTTSMKVINDHPWFGSVNYLQTPEMESLRTGEGIIDIVNTYIGVTLETGYAGLGLFAGFFILTLFGINRAMRSFRDKDSEERLLGRALLATLVAIMVIIFTVSSITIIPIVYWSVAGMGVAYAQMARMNAGGINNFPTGR